jgi:solute carrier family 25 oxoglutarate transporter 11
MKTSQNNVSNNNAITNSNNNKKPISPITNLAIASIGACIATACVHPFDVIRLRRQVQSHNPIILSNNNNNLIRETKTIIANEGIKGLYSGVSAGLLRQFFYGTSRFGFFNVFQDAVLVYHKNNNKTMMATSGRLTFTENLLCALAAGGLAGVIGNPADVALTRMAADAKSEPSKRRNYRNGLHAMYRCFKDEGFQGIMKGVGPHVARALVVNGVMLTSYAETKKVVSDFVGINEETLLAQFLAGNVAGFNSAFLAMPLDVMKSRLQYARPGEYVGLRHAANVIYKEGGIKAFWIGFVPLWLKLAPHTTITMLIVERLRKWVGG